jgi:hypothetical protein
MSNVYVYVFTVLVIRNNVAVITTIKTVTLKIVIRRGRATFLYEETQISRSRMNMGMMDV